MESLEVRLQLSGASDLVPSTSTLSAPAYAIAAVTVGSKALFAHDTLFAHDRGVDVFDSKTNQWSTTNFPQDFRCATAARAGTKAIFAGSSADASDTNLVDVFDTVLGTWAVNKVPRTGSIIQSASIGDQAFFLGRDQFSSGYVLSYNAKTSKWGELPFPKYNYLDNMVAIGTKVIFSFMYDVPTVYDVMTRRWSLLPMNSTSPHRIGGLSVGTKGFYLDGHTLNVFDAVQGTWSVGPSIQAVNARTSVGSKVIFAGIGQYKNFPEPDYPTVVSVYDEATGSLSFNALSVARGAISATAVGNQAFFSGGIIQALLMYGPAVKKQILDTVDIFTDQNPSPVLAGGVAGNIGHRAHVTVINTGDADLAGGYTVQLYASTDRTLTDAILVGNMAVSSSLTAGASSTFNFKTKIPTNTPAGTYHLLAAIRDTAGNITPIAAEEAIFRVRRAKTVASPGVSHVPSTSTHGAWSRVQIV